MRFEAYRLPVCGCTCDSEWVYLGVVVAQDAETATHIAARCAKLQLEYVYVVPCHHTTTKNEEQLERLPHLTK